MFTLVFLVTDNEPGVLITIWRGKKTNETNYLGARLRNLRSEVNFPSSSIGPYLAKDRREQHDSSLVESSVSSCSKLLIPLPVSHCSNCAHAARYTSFTFFDLFWAFRLYTKQGWSSPLSNISGLLAYYFRSPMMDRLHLALSKSFLNFSRSSCAMKGTHSPESAILARAEKM